MRFTVYGEDWRPDRPVQVLHEQVRDEPDISYVGLRIFLGPDVIHRPGDDDTSALNLFLPRTEDGRPDFSVVRKVLVEALAVLGDVEANLDL